MPNEVRRRSAEFRLIARFALSLIHEFNDIDGCYNGRTSA